MARNRNAEYYAHPGERVRIRINNSDETCEQGWNDEMEAVSGKVFTIGTTRKDNEGTRVFFTDMPEPANKWSWGLDMIERDYGHTAPELQALFNIRTDF